jgi:hypothetical protein
MSDTRSNEKAARITKQGATEAAVGQDGRSSASIGLPFLFDLAAPALLRATVGHGSFDAGDVRFRSTIAKGNPQQSEFVPLSISGQVSLGRTGELMNRESIARHGGHGASRKRRRPSGELKLLVATPLICREKHIGVIERGLCWLLGNGQPVAGQNVRRGFLPQPRRACRTS